MIDEITHACIKVQHSDRVAVCQELLSPDVQHLVVTLTD